MSAVTFPPALGGNGATYTDDADPATGLDGYGYVTRLVPMFAQIVLMAQSAYNSALSAVNGPGTNATSTTANTLGTGAKSFTIQTGKNFVVGQSVIAVDTANPTTKYLIGQVTAHNATTGALTIQATVFIGSGSVSNWTISLGPLPREVGDVLLDLTNGLQRWDGVALGAITADTLKITRVLYQLATGEARYWDGAAAQALSAAGLKVNNLVYQVAGLAKYWTGSAEADLPTVPVVQEFTASGTWTKPTGRRFHLVELWAAGASGGRTDAGNAGGGGGGAYKQYWFTDAELAASVAVTIGAGGPGVTGTGTNGNNGGNTLFGTQLTAYGGEGGKFATAGTATPGGTGGSPTGVAEVGTDAGRGNNVSDQKNANFGGGGGGSVSSGNVPTGTTDQPGMSSLAGCGGGGVGTSAAPGASPTSRSGGGPAGTAGGNAVNEREGGGAGTAGNGGNGAPKGGGGGASKGAGFTSGAGGRGHARITSF